MLGEEMLEPVVVESAQEILESNATNIMGEMFGVEVVESVKGVSKDFSQFVSTIPVEQFNSALIAGGIGAIAGFTLGLALTIYCEKREEECTGHKPVPRLGIGCSIIPSATLYGAVGGFVGRLIFP